VDRHTPTDMSLLLMTLGLANIAVGQREN